ncbi:beta-eliminating lyase family protein [Bacillus pseudomycoides]|nr:beta-eliminating lyase family protein [Bacillus pseudomycoides]
MIELRSDTFTLPTEKMLKTMSSAALGDDIYGEDPTVHELEKLAARILDKEAGCFMPSGTMANLATLMAHCPRGTKAIVGNESDIYIYMKLVVQPFVEVLSMNRFRHREMGVY